MRKIICNLNTDKILARGRHVLLALFMTAGSGQAFAHTAYVTHFNDGKGSTVSAIDTTTNAVTAEIAVGAGPLGIAITPDGTRAYVANNFDNSVSVIDTAKNSVVATISNGIGVFPTGVAITDDGKYAYVTNEGSNTVSVIAIATNTVVASSAAGFSPSEIAILPGGKHALVLNLDSDTVSLLPDMMGPKPGKLMGVKVKESPSAVAFTADGRAAFVASSTEGSTGTVSVIDTKNPSKSKVIKTVTVGNAPSGIAVGNTPLGECVYVTNRDDGTLSIMRISDKPFLKTMAGGVMPSALAFTPDGLYAYVADVGNNTLFAFNTKSLKVEAVIPVAKQPACIAFLLTPPPVVESIESSSDWGISAFFQSILDVFKDFP